MPYDQAQQAERSRVLLTGGLDRTEMSCEGFVGEVRQQSSELRMWTGRWSASPVSGVPREASRPNCERGMWVSRTKGTSAVRNPGGSRVTCVSAPVKFRPLQGRDRGWRARRCSWRRGETPPRACGGGGAAERWELGGAGALLRVKAVRWRARVRRWLRSGETQGAEGCGAC